MKPPIQFDPSRCSPSVPRDENGNVIVTGFEPSENFTIEQVVHWAPGLCYRDQLLEYLSLLIERFPNAATLPPPPKFKGFVPVGTLLMSPRSWLNGLMAL